MWVASTSAGVALQVERLVAKLEALRQDADQAEERAAQVSEEAKELAQTLEERRGNLDSRAQNLVMARNKVDRLAQVGSASEDWLSWSRRLLTYVQRDT